MQPLPSTPVLASGSDPTLTALYDSLTRRRRLGPQNRTAKNYERSWTPLVRHLEAVLGWEARLSDLTTENVNLYLVQAGVLHAWSEQSVKTNGGNIRSVVSGMRRHRLVPPDTLLGWELPQVTEGVPVYFDEVTLDRIFGKLETERTTRNLRLRAAAQIMLDAGPRPEEVVELLIADLRSDRSQLHVRGKGARNRVVPVGETTWRYLDDYMRVRPRPESPTERVFVSARGAGGPITPGVISSDMHDLLVELGLVGSDAPADPGYKLYTMRKTFAHRAAEGGMDVAEVAAIMGHKPASIPMLLRLYYQASDEQKQVAHTASRPAESFHEWRATRRTPTAADRPLAYFERWSGGLASARLGNSPSRWPSSHKRGSGA